MESLVCTEKSTETRVKWLACLHLLQEYLDELDATINGPAAYNNEPLVLSERDSMFFLSVMENPPEPNQALISLFREYGSSKESSNAL
jgi:hypothetical protein